MCVQSQYCSYRHYSADLKRSDPESIIAMFTAFFDDSGTDRNSDIAVAACYVSTKRGWDDFVEDWDHIRWEESFDCFHMAHFVAPCEQGHKPWCDWDNVKKSHVYSRIAKAINSNKRIGIAAAVPKEIWDSTPEYIRQHYGREHYTFAVRMCMMRIAEWRRISMPSSFSIRYVFDWEMRDSQKRYEISKILDSITQPEFKDSAYAIFGIEPKGYSFEHKEEFKPLQAADILAWQMRCHMQKIWPIGHDEPDICHDGFRQLRENQEMDLGFFNEDQIRRFVIQNEQLIEAKGPLPILYP